MNIYAQNQYKLLTYCVSVVVSGDFYCFKRAFPPLSSLSKDVF